MKLTTKRGHPATNAWSDPDESAIPSGIGRSHTRHGLRLRLALVRDECPQLLAGLEHWNGASSHLDRIPGAGVPRHTRLAATDLEGPEPADLDVVLVLERVLHRLEESVHDPGAVLLGDHWTRGLGNRGGHLFDEIGLGHASPRRFAGSGASRPPSADSRSLSVVCQGVGNPRGNPT